jgi:hypothetical protein
MRSSATSALGRPDGAFKGEDLPVEVAALYRIVVDHAQTLYSRPHQSFNDMAANGAEADHRHQAGLQQGETFFPEQSPGADKSLVVHETSTFFLALGA